MKYDEEYYRTGNYVNYLQRQNRHTRLISELDSFLSKMGLNFGPVLDFGCAVGFMMEQFRLIGYDVEGVEISDWARERCLEKGLRVTANLDPDRYYNITLALDVLEHLTEDQLEDFLSTLQTNVLIFRMPTVLEGEDDYHIKEARTDPTHLIRWTDDQWYEEFESHGYYVMPLMMEHIYAAEGACCGIAFKLY